MAVVHLVWAPLGLDVIRGFVAAYRRHPPGYPHRLVVALNGHANDDARAAALRAFDGVPHDPFVLPSPVQDIAAYVGAAAAVDTRFVCFLNSYSRPLAAGWLDKLVAHAVRPSVGLVGATGSWESIYEFLAYSAGRPEPLPRTADPRRWIGWARAAAHQLPRVALARLQFPPFPNAHIRSNAFLLRRDLFLELRFGALATKRAAYRFESGRRGLTRQVQALGLDALVVGRDGAAYPPPAWRDSDTYKIGTQANLLVADNQTAAYTDAEPGERRRLSRLAWGDA